MNSIKLLAKLEKMSLDYSYTALSIVEDMINDYDNFQELYDNYVYEVERYFTYYTTAWNYLMDEGFVDFTEPITMGYNTITEFACYFLEEEISDILVSLDQSLYEEDK